MVGRTCVSVLCQAGGGSYEGNPCTERGACSAAGLALRRVLCVAWRDVRGSPGLALLLGEQTRRRDVSVGGNEAMAAGLLEGAQALPEGERTGCEILLEGGSLSVHGKRWSAGWEKPGGRGEGG